mgnify:CR=1 FL=1
MDEEIWIEFGKRMSQPGNLNFPKDDSWIDFAYQWKKDFDEIPVWNKRVHNRKTFSGFVEVPQEINFNFQEWDYEDVDYLYLKNGKPKYAQALYFADNDYTLFFKDGFYVQRYYNSECEEMVTHHRKNLTFKAGRKKLECEFLQESDFEASFYFFKGDNYVLEYFYLENLVDLYRTNIFMLNSNEKDFSKFVEGIGYFENSEGQILKKSLEKQFPEFVI